MKVSKVSKIVSLIICSIIILIVPTTVVDYMRVKNYNEGPIFCLKREARINNNVSIFTCKSFIYKYYEITSINYINKKFIPLWKELDGTYE